jgi:hypothetical protein
MLVPGCFQCCHTSHEIVLYDCSHELLVDLQGFRSNISTLKIHVHPLWSVSWKVIMNWGSVNEKLSFLRTEM